MNKYTPKTGEVYTEPSKSGEKVWAISNGKHIGTIKEQSYVKGLKFESLLHYPVLSATMTLEELACVEGYGVRYFVIERGDTKETHSISIEDFKAHGEYVTPPGYSKQIRCPLHFYQTTAKKSKRNKRLNNPPIETPGYQRPLQMSLFDRGLAAGAHGDIY